MMSIRFATALLVLALSHCAVAETELFTAFENKISQRQVGIVNLVATCGCATHSPLPELRQHIQTVPEFVDASIFALGSQILFNVTKILLAQCQCVSGIEIVDGAAAEPVTLAGEFADSADVETLLRRVANILQNVNFACCDPEHSTRLLRYIDGAFTYEEAQRDAAARGGYLATVSSREDNVAALLAIGNGAGKASGDGQGGDFLWIGLEYDDDTSQWVWQDEMKLIGFTNWGLMEPDNQKSDKCVGLCTTYQLWQRGTRGQWNSLQCLTRLPYLLERPRAPPAPTQEPGEFRLVTIIITAFLGLFLIGSIVIVVRKLCLAHCPDKFGMKPMPKRSERPRRRRRQSAAPPAPGTELQETPGQQQRSSSRPRGSRSAGTDQVPLTGQEAAGRTRQARRPRAGQSGGSPPNSQTQRARQSTTDGGGPTNGSHPPSSPTGVPLPSAPPIDHSPSFSPREAGSTGAGDNVKPSPSGLYEAQSMVMEDAQSPHVTVTKQPDAQPSAVFAPAPAAAKASPKKAAAAPKVAAKAAPAKPAAAKHKDPMAAPPPAPPPPPPPEEEEAIAAVDMSAAAEQEPLAPPDPDAEEGVEYEEYYEGEEEWAEGEEGEEQWEEQEEGTAVDVPEGQ